MEHHFGSGNLESRNHSRTAFVGATPLLYLHAACLIDLLPRFYPRVLTSHVAASEVMAHVAEGVSAPRLDQLPWLSIVDLPVPSAPPPPGVTRANHALIQSALESLPSIAILEDRHARRAAQKAGCVSTGTLGILLMARQEGLIPSVADALITLSGNGYNFSRKTITSALLLCREPERLGDVLGGD